jgi:NIPSNAP
MHNHRSHLLFVTPALIGLSMVAGLFAEHGYENAGEKKSKPVADPATSREVFEILTLDIKAGRRNEFHKVYETESLPLLKKWNFDVVTYGPSLHDDNSYYVIRAFKSLEDRQKAEEAFYNSDDWKSGPREAIMGLVEHFSYAVVSAETWKKASAEISAATNVETKQAR